ncbi:unnamed protein product [Didymodactylos carnosus]|uniref:Carbohydrate sulfotransferase n=1 Tax=Didymodactylos carnosus TaxID=1234261 RepID=A0A815Q4T2_9BILA|nr:unnamed protein product [Didymodactylos carnosus]CAF1458551.1 unnamed protein product [Didymodactylos carnosus]CAF3808282.1 unnamed protein product [Didymodactylos carnosus]CAF4329578.1 unnamed protein product [Didymodactylos carnosus]
MGPSNINFFQIMEQPNFNNLSSFCKKITNETPYSNLLNVKRLNSIACPVPKVASTNILRIILLTSNERYLKQTKKQNNALIAKLNSSYLYTTIYPTIYSMKLKNMKFNDRRNLLKNTTIFKFVIVRHPFKRIISVFYDKFIYPEPFESKEWRYRKRVMLKTLKHKNFTFKTFLLYIVYSIEHNFKLNIHWDRVVTVCDFCKVKFDWIGKYENFDEDVDILLKRLNIDSKVSFPSHKLDPNHKKLNIDDKKMYNMIKSVGEKKYNVLLNYYRPDFEAFNYTAENFQTET